MPDTIAGMEEEKRKFVLFDFDGVIADSFSVCMKTARNLCVHITEEQYRAAFEGNVYEKHAEMMSPTHGPECHHDRDWFEIYIPLLEAEGKLVPGIEEVITALAHRYVLIVISSSVHSPIQGFLEKHHIGRYFAEIMGADLHPQKLDKIKMVFERYKTSPEECIFLTDTLGDMQEAKAAGVAAVGVTWGFHTRSTLEKGEPFRIVDTAVELPAAVSDYFARVR
jgi:phosphoglycolate phosphatase